MQFVDFEEGGLCKIRQMRLPNERKTYARRIS